MPCRNRIRRQRITSDPRSYEPVTSEKAPNDCCAHLLTVVGVEAMHPARGSRTASKRLQIPPPASRNTALMELAAEIPAKVPSDLLGISIESAVDWTRQPATPGPDTRPRSPAGAAEPPQLASTRMRRPNRAAFFSVIMTNRLCWL